MWNGMNSFQRSALPITTHLAFRLPQPFAIALGILKLGGAKVKQSHGWILAALAVTTSAQAALHKPTDVAAYEARQVKNTLLRMVANPVQACFKKWEKKHSGFKQGKVHVDWEIQPNGRVKKLNVIHSDLKGMEPCVLSSMKHAVFPTPPDRKPYYVAHRFLFKNEK